MAEKIDLKKTLDSYLARSGEFRIVEVPTMQYLMIDGSGDPNISSQFARALEALYPVSFTLKFVSKQQLGRDYVVPPLEALWWSDEWDTFTTARDTSRWFWTLMLMTPDWIPAELVDVAVAKAGVKDAPASLEAVRFESLDEGTSVQTLHLGPFDDEGPTLARMHDEFIPNHGLRMRGKHHEIYFSDRRRVHPTKFRTILRQPVEPAERDR